MRSEAYQWFAGLSLVAVAPAALIINVVSVFWVNDQSARIAWTWTCLATVSAALTAFLSVVFWSFPGYNGKFIVVASSIAFAFNLALIATDLKYFPKRIAACGMSLVGVLFVGLQIFYAVRSYIGTPKESDPVEVKLWRTHIAECDGDVPWQIGYCPDKEKFVTAIRDFKAVKNWKRFPCEAVRRMDRYWTHYLNPMYRRKGAPAPDYRNLDQHLFCQCFMSHKHIRGDASEHLDRYCACNSGATQDLDGFSCEGPMGFENGAGGVEPRPGEVIGTIRKEHEHSFVVKVAVDGDVGSEPVVEYSVYLPTGELDESEDSVVHFRKVEKKYPRLSIGSEAPLTVF